MDHEKVAPVDEKVVHDHAQPTVSSTEGDYAGEWREQENYMTRNGLNLKSFQRRPKGGPLVVLDKSMKTRHLHMIAIGGSIGAGFFVSSGAALANGVSHYISKYTANTSNNKSRALPHSSLISPSWEL
jgi:amino acid transporter